MKTGRRRTKPSPGFVPLRDLVPRNDPKGGSALKTVFGEPPPVPETEEELDQQKPAERRQKPGRDQRRKKGGTA